VSTELQRTNNGSVYNLLMKLAGGAYRLVKECCCCDWCAAPLNVELSLGTSDCACQDYSELSVNCTGISWTSPATIPSDGVCSFSGTVGSLTTRYYDDIGCDPLNFNRSEVYDIFLSVWRTDNEGGGHTWHAEIHATCGWYIDFESKTQPTGSCQDLTLNSTSQNFSGGTITLKFKK
jgi:hypothetical protein